MSKRVTLSPAARDELRAAAKWYDDARPGLGLEFLAATRVAVRRIREKPSAGGPVAGVIEEIAARQVLLRRFPYAVVYLELAEESRVLAFAHTSRRPGYWRGR